MRVLVLGAGGPAGVNTCRALKGHEVVAADEVKEHLVWPAQHCSEVVHMPEVTVEAVNEVGADVVIPQPDKLTMWLADHASDIEAATFLPDRRTVALCQDKFECGLQWRRSRLRTDRISLVELNQGVWEVPEPPFWIRARWGAGAKAAILAKTKAEGIAWRKFWNLRDTGLEFVTEGYLPGRDFAWSSIWYEGELVTSFARERLEYLYPGLTPEGLTGTPTRARIVHYDEVNQAAYEAVLAVDGKPHGIYSVDLREDSEGWPRPTEINAGRGFTTFGQWAQLTQPNLMEIVVQLAAKDPYWWVPFGSIPSENCIPEGTELRRHIDCGTVVYHPVCA